MLGTISYCSHGNSTTQQGSFSGGAGFGKGSNGVVAFNFSAMTADNTNSISAIPMNPAKPKLFFIGQ